MRCPSAMLLPLHRSSALPPPLRATLDELTLPGFANLVLEPSSSQISASRCPHAFSLLSCRWLVWVAAKDDRGRWSWRHRPSQWKPTPRIECRYSLCSPRPGTSAGCLTPTLSHPGTPQTRSPSSSRAAAALTVSFMRRTTPKR
jgi:hypothetical protein